MPRSRLTLALAALAGTALAAPRPAGAQDYTYTPLDVPGATFGTYATGINAAGQIVGSYGNSTGFHGFLNNGGTYTTLDVPSGLETFGYGINAAGLIVGTYNAPGARGFRYNAGTYTPFDAPGGLGATVALGINDAGRIVGYYTDNTGTHGFLATATVPEPSALALVGAGLLVVGGVARRRRATRA